MTEPLPDSLDGSKGSKMPCETMRLPNQTISERKTEIRAAIANLSAAIIAGRVKPIVGPQGAIAFKGWSDDERNRVTDNCAYRLTMATGSALAKAAIAKAEALAGRAVDRKVVAQGGHYHGDVYHEHK